MSSSPTALIPPEWADETKTLRKFLYWFSQNSEFTPLTSILCNYATVRALNTWLGPSACKQCEHYMRFLGYNIHSPAFREVCTCVASIAYREALKNPMSTIQMAQQTVQIISKAVQNIADMPENASLQHHEFLNAILHNKGSPMDLLKTGMKIYNQKAQGMGEWLHVGLPEILDTIHNSTSNSMTPAHLAEYSEQVYQKWRLWGKTHKEIVSKAASSSPISKKTLSNKTHGDEGTSLTPPSSPPPSPPTTASRFSASSILYMV